MESQQAEQVQLVETLQQYLTMCESGAFHGLLDLEVPSAGDDECIPATTGWFDVRLQSTDVAEAHEAHLLSPVSARRMQGLDDRLEFWRQRLALVAKLGSRRSSPVQAAGKDCAEQPIPDSLCCRKVQQR